VEGETLNNFIKRSDRLEVKLALEIATQVAAGLAAVHKQKLVHRDIKPSNIMVSLEDGGDVTAKIIDLGLAKAVIETGSERLAHAFRQGAHARKVMESYQAWFGEGPVLAVSACIFATSNLKAFIPCTGAKRMNPV
jgi:serine/threonine protein kinase